MSKSHHVLSLNSERPTQEAAATVAVNERALSDRLAVIHFWPCNPDRGLLLFLRAMVVVFVVSFFNLCDILCIWNQQWQLESFKFNCEQVVDGRGFVHACV
jgi:hypothetical protein